MLVRDEALAHRFGWGPLGCPEAPHLPCMVSVPTIEMAAFPLPCSCIPEPVHVINHVAYCTLFITHCIINVVSFECNLHHFTYSGHCGVRCNALVFGSAWREVVVIRFSKALGLGGWWKLPKLSLVSKRSFSKTQRAQRKLTYLSPAAWFWNSVPN